MYDSKGFLSGHRGEYYDVLTPLLGMTRTPSFREALLSKQPVLVASIEYSLPSYALLAISRALMGRHTAGFLFRPLPVAEATTWRLKIKRWTLRAVKAFRRTGTFTILPFSVEPRFADIASHWIYDPQFWDLHYPAAEIEDRQEGPLAQQTREQAAGRLICSAVGRQDEHKGFDQLGALYEARADVRERMLCAVGGTVFDEFKPLAARIEKLGAAIHDRYIDREELLDLYACANVVWSCYAADYDQASGVFGRAAQLGIPTIVRQGSLLERYCQAEGIGHVAYDGTPAHFALDAIPAPDSAAQAAARARAQGKQSIRQLLAALGID